MARTGLLFLIVAFFAAILCVLSAPVPVEEEARSIEKRTSYTGQGTWYEVGMGACGKRNKNSDFVVALDAGLYGNGQHCEKTMTITDTQTGKVTTAAIVDKCPGCGHGSLDMSPSLFEHFASLNQGVIKIKWSFN
ncbi:hypothetical protein JAAARDRAFT_181136 [Jaapia argillacea MUCL 33604]|uniref:RlpA-like protein double-psi beta-barrel domain-containing protein n=1 Tax=Jaapia argillacea MUCL 33604 TaxID=933084 RepID=A0A067PK00_9AGAM|nr:hypothetical protein JAAARDRAFT_181136 [Jaapia argillacea MUCL 33604]